MSEKKGTILYIGNYIFPQDNAAGKRVYSNCCILRDLGYRVISIGNNAGNTDKMSPEDIMKYDGIDSFSFCYSNGKKRLCYWVYFKRIMELIHKLNIENDIYAVILYANLSISLFNIRMRKWAQKKGIRCYADCADWFEPPKENLMLRLWKKIDTDLQMNVFNRSVDGVICISSFLSNYYGSSHTVVIPPLTNISKKQSFVLTDCENDSVSFVYAGSKFRAGQPVHPQYWKDRLDLMIKGFYEAKLKDPSIKFEFRIIGITKEEFIGHLPLELKAEYQNITDELASELIFFDYLPHDIVENLISGSNFSVLIRDKKRMTMVGFPTKVSESISCGTPVVYNDTSDIHQYVGDGRFGFMVDGTTLADTIISIVHLDRSTLNSMKEDCYNNNPFDYRLFLNKMKEFLEVTKDAME